MVLVKIVQITNLPILKVESNARCQSVMIEKLLPYRENVNNATLTNIRSTESIVRSGNVMTVQSYKKTANVTNALITTNQTPPIYNVSYHNVNQTNS